MLVDYPLSPLTIVCSSSLLIVAYDDAVIDHEGRRARQVELGGERGRLLDRLVHSGVSHVALELRRVEADSLRDIEDALLGKLPGRLHERPVERQVLAVLAARSNCRVRGHMRIRREDRALDEGDTNFQATVDQSLHRTERGFAIRAAIVEELRDGDFRVRRADDKGNLGIDKGGRADIEQRVIAGLLFGGGLLRVEPVRHLDDDVGMGEKIFLDDLLDLGAVCPHADRDRNLSDGDRGRKCSKRKEG